MHPPLFLDKRASEIVTETPATTAPVAAAEAQQGLFIGNMVPSATSDMLG